MTDDTRQVVQFIKEKYQKSVCVMKLLPSYDDTNILLQSDEPLSASCPAKFIFKIFTSDSNESFTQKILCVNLLLSRKFVCSQFIKGLDGNYCQVYNEEEHFEKEYAVLYTFLDGKELEHTGYVNYPCLIHELGSFIACIHSTLKEMPVNKILIPDQEDPWSFNNYELLLKECTKDIVTVRSKRETVSSILNSVIDTLKPAESTLTKDVLHGDIHGLNIIVKDSYNPAQRSSNSNADRCFGGGAKLGTGPVSFENKISKTSQETMEDLNSMVEEFQSANEGFKLKTDLLSVYGIIDFNDVSYSFTVFEIGRLIADVMVTYLVQCRKVVSHQDQTVRVVTDLSKPCQDHLLKIGRFILAGYLCVKPLTETDLNCIYPAVLTSLCQYYVLGTKAAVEKPDSKDYVSYCGEEAFMLLEFFHTLDEQVVSRFWSVTA